MSEVVVVSRAQATPYEADRSLWLAGVLLMSFASLLLELALTRLFSVILFYHFAFLAISIALLGLGAGGVFAYLRKDWLARWSTRALGARIGLMNAIAIVAVLEVDLHFSVALNITAANLLRLTAIYLVSAVPFFLTGVFLSVAFARRASGIAHLYAGDLAGASAACLAVVPLLNHVGGPSTVLMAAAAMAGSAAIWADCRRARAAGICLSLALVVLGGLNYSGKLVDVIYAKGMRRDAAWVLFARWNAISRVEVDDQSGAKVIVIDADASTYIMNDDPQHVRPETRESLFSAAPSVANVLRPQGSYAIIGPGGGVDVLRALASGSPSVTGIEINPIIVNDIMDGRFADYSYHLYQRPDVHMHVSDGRSWVRSSREQYDVLQMTLVDTWASTAAGAFALTENNLYTTEAFQEYFDHLKPNGFLAITRWEFQQPREALRVVSVAMEALRRSGVSGSLEKHFIVVSEGPLDIDGRPVTVLASKSGFSPEEEQAITAHLAQYPRLALLYSPSRANGGQVAPGGQPFVDLILSGDPWQFARGYRYDVSPVTDNSPFFFFNLKPAQIWSTRSEHGIDWKVNVGVVILGAVLAVSILAVLAFLVLPLAFQDKARSLGPAPLLYFVAIGLGYILVEITFIQRFVLFLGHPVYALTVVVFLMLLSSGVGSFVSRRWLPDPKNAIPRLRTLLLAVAAALVLYLWALPWLLDSAVGLPFTVKLALSGAFLIPIGFLMGMPFPTGLRALATAARQENDNSVEWAWAMNAAASVLGSVAAMVIAIQFGLTVVLVCGALAYLLAAASSRRLIRAMA
jgi:hypothetical protein